MTKTGVYSDKAKKDVTCWLKQTGDLVDISKCLDVCPFLITNNMLMVFFPCFENNIPAHEILLVNETIGVRAMNRDDHLLLIDVLTPHMCRHLAFLM